MLESHIACYLRVKIFEAFYLLLIVLLGNMGQITMKEKHKFEIPKDIAMSKLSIQLFPIFAIIILKSAINDDNKSFYSNSFLPMWNFLISSKTFFLSGHSAAAFASSEYLSNCSPREGLTYLTALVKYHSGTNITIFFC